MRRAFFVAIVLAGSFAAGSVVTAMRPYWWVVWEIKPQLYSFFAEGEYGGAVIPGSAMRENMPVVFATNGMECYRIYRAKSVKWDARSDGICWLSDAPRG